MGDVSSDLFKRANHNALERKRRDNIKDSFESLQEAVPTINEERPSRSTVLNKATAYIYDMNKGILDKEVEIAKLQALNELLQGKIDELSDMN